MKINKIEISNFRGIRGNYPLDFTNQSEISKLLVLDGENGFGKTTIFDAIEFCLTGNIKRLKDLPNFNVQKNILKNRLKDEKNIQLETYIKITFDNNKEISISLKKEHGGKLDDDYVKGGEDRDEVLKNINIKDFKNIFYLPQDDSTELLKSGKGGDGGYLSYIDKHIGIKEEVEYKNRVLINDNNSNGRIIKSVKQLITEIETKKKNTDDNVGRKHEKLDELNKNSFTIKKINFIENKLLSENSDKWKNKEKYTRTDLDNIYIPNWKNLLNLVQNQAGLENYNYNYQINSKVKYINENRNYFINNYNYYLFYLEDNKSKSKEKINLENEIKLFKGDIESIGYIDNLILLKNNDTKLNNISKLFPNLKGSDKFYAELLEIENKFQEIKKELEELNEEQKEYNKIFGNLIDFWDEKFNKYENEDLIINDNNDKINSGTCPLCKTPNKREDIKFQLEFLRKKSGNDIEKGKKKLFSVIYNEDLYKKLEEYIKKLETELKDINTFEKIREDIQNNESIFKDIEFSINKYYEESKVEKKEIKKLSLNKNLSNDEKVINTNLLEDIIVFGNNKLKPSLIDNNKFLELNTKYNDLFQNDYIYTDKYLKNLKEVDVKNNIDYFENELIKLKDNEKRSVEKEIKILKKEIEFYSLRIKFLEFTNNNILKKYSESLEQHIQQFKEDKIKSIALPFYIFNQRIVKNYNGMKFYLTADFICGEKGTKNPMYSLSSGQTEGLALSLMLSNNLSYKTELKTLLIDDPIQSLDDLNILSFINLLRYQFSDKQIIISTHDDGFSRFIRYKFWRLYGNNSQKNINMKEEFFNVKNKINE